MKRSRKAWPARPWLWILILSAAFLLATTVSWTSLVVQMNNDVYDWMTRLRASDRINAAPPLVVGLDEEAFRTRGGVGATRAILADLIEEVCAANPPVIAIDVILADSGDPAQTRTLADRIGACPQQTAVVLSSSLTSDGRDWELPTASLATNAEAMGHVQTVRDPYDSVVREYALEVRAIGRRYWGLALETYRASDPARKPLTEAPEALRVGPREIASALDADGLRRMFLDFGHPVDYLPAGSLDEAARQRIRGALGQQRPVFIGVTALSASRDRVATPLAGGDEMPGVFVHAHAYNTLLAGPYAARASNSITLALGILITAAAGLLFYFFSGWRAYALASLLFLLAVIVPFERFFDGRIVIPYFTPLLTALLAIGTAASLRYFADRRLLLVAERDRERYQHAIQLVTHEMRTPLTAIQGSSELMGRYSLAPEKQKELAGMINSESKRLAKMIQTFLDVERLSAGEMELKTDLVPVPDLVTTCVARTRILAERKHIALHASPIPDAQVRGDAELLEYAIYNVLTNAVKYSPQETEIQVRSWLANGRIAVAVADQGIGMTQAEVRNIFRKFYRTASAQKSGEQGTGIGLALVKEIVERHGGTIEVESTPGKGSCFTVWIPGVA